LSQNFKDLKDHSVVKRSQDLLLSIKVIASTSNVSQGTKRQVRGRESCAILEKECRILDDRFGIEWVKENCLFNH